ncbi:hypothetical protein Emag_000507 [Eimeria magna]
MARPIMQRANRQSATAEELAASSSGRALVTSNPSILAAAAAAATAAAAAAAAAPAVASLALGCVEPQCVQQQTSVSPTSSGQHGVGQHNQRGSSKPLVLNGRVRYTFATRTAEETLPHSAPYSDSRDIATVSSSTRSVRDVGAANESGFVGGNTTVIPGLDNQSKGSSSDLSRDSAGDTCDLDSSGTGSKRIASPGSGSCGSRSSAGGGLRPPDPHQAKNIKGSKSDCSGVRQESRLPDSPDVSSSSDSKSNSAIRSSSGGSRQKQQLPPLVAPDIALLIRDFATFVQRVERQLQQLQHLQQQQQFDDAGEGEQQQQEQKGPQQQFRWSQTAPWANQPPANGGRLRQQHLQEQEQHQVLQQQRWLRQQLQQQQDCRLLLRSVSEGAVVCRSLHARLSSLLLEPATAAGAANAGGSELLLAKLRRDFSQQEQQYTRLVRLLDSFAEALQEASKTSEQRQIREAVRKTSSGSRTGSSCEAAAAVASEQAAKALTKRRSPARIVWHSSSSSSSSMSGSFSRGIEFDFSHFCYPRAQRQPDSILWSPVGERDLMESRGVVGLPRLLIGPSPSSLDRLSQRRASSGELSQDLWEPAALLEVDEDYEKRQILNERKEQLQQLREVERCVSVLREMQVHVAENVTRGEELLCAAEEQTEAAADHTAAGAGELAAAARSKSRWWGVKGGGAAALLGVGLGAVAGGPIGAAVGAVVGAVAGVSSGAALRVRHRERVTAIERSVRRRRTQHRLKRSSVAAAETVSTSRLVSAVSSATRSLQGPSTGVRSEERGSRPAHSQGPTYSASGTSVLNEARSQRGGTYDLGGVLGARSKRSDACMNGKNVNFKPTRGSLREAVRGSGQQERTSRAAEAKAKDQSQQEGKVQQQRGQQDQAHSGVVSGKSGAAGCRQRGAEESAQAVAMRVPLTVPGLLPAVQFLPR